MIHGIVRFLSKLSSEPRMESQDLSDHSKEFLKEEFAQCWEHYRHLERLRDASVGFGIALGIGVLGFAAKTFDAPIRAQDVPWTAVLLFFLAFITTLIMWLLLCTVLKSKAVMEHYEKSLRWIRSQVYQGECEFVADNLDTRRNLASAWDSVALTRQGFAVLILSIFIVASVFAQIVLLVWAAPQLPKPQFWICLAFVAGAFLVSVFSGPFLRSRWKRHRRESPRLGIRRR